MPSRGVNVTGAKAASRACLERLLKGLHDALGSVTVLAHEWLVAGLKVFLKPIGSQNYLPAETTVFSESDPYAAVR